MTRKQAQYALIEIANSGNVVSQTNAVLHGVRASIWLNGVGKVFSGRVEYEPRDC